MPASADQVRNQEWWLSSLHITSAWAASKGSGVTVAVLSDGVNASAPDLARAVITGAVPTGFPIASAPYQGELGTSIASLIAGRGHGPSGGAGVVGVAPQARILSIPVTLPPDDPQLAQSSVATAIPGAIAAGIRYAVNHGATVIDLPIDPGQAGSSGSGGATAAAGGSAAERDAVKFALAHNVVLVAPAGDDETAGDAPNFPAAYPGVIAVGAFNPSFTKAPWSSRQRYVTLTAAGVGVIAADNAGGYQTMNSSSAASAVVSGIAALIRSRYPGLTRAEVRQALITTTTLHRAGGPANGSGYGAVNASGAMTAAAALAAPPGKRAAAGALPREAPAAVPAPPSSQGIGAQILRAAEISGAVLLFLLLLIVAYEAVGRRRPGNRPAVAAEWTHRPPQSRYPHAGGSDADAMLELFAAPAQPPAVWEAAAQAARHRPQPAGGGGWPGGGGGVFAQAAGREPGGSSGGRPGQPGQPGQPGGPRQLGGPGAEAPAAAGVAEGGWLSHGPASQAINRRAPVSGAPPWEPASAPGGDLPWAAVPGRYPDGAAADERASEALASDERAWGAPAHIDQPAAAVEHESPAYRPDYGYNPFGRADHAAGHHAAGDRPADGFSSPVGASPSGPYPIPSVSRVPPGPAASNAYRSPTGSGAPDGFDSGSDYRSRDFGYRDDSAGPAGQSGEFDAPPAPKLAASGLPVRQPRATRPPGAPQSSPGGSLWERVSRDASQESEPADNQDQSYDAAGQPIFVWDPARHGESR